MKKTKKKVIIMGAAGRDFHNFNIYFKNNPHYKVVAFTAFQIPNIAGRKYKNIPIFSEEKLLDLIKKKDVQEVFFSYSKKGIHFLGNERVNNLSCLLRIKGIKPNYIIGK